MMTIYIVFDGICMVTLGILQETIYYYNESLKIKPSWLDEHIATDW